MQIWLKQEGAEQAQAGDSGEQYRQALPRHEALYSSHTRPSLPGAHRGCTAPPPTWSASSHNLSSQDPSIMQTPGGGQKAVTWGPWPELV